MSLDQLHMLKDSFSISRGRVPGRREGSNKKGTGDCFGSHRNIVASIYISSHLRRITGFALAGLLVRGAEVATITVLLSHDVYLVCHQKHHQLCSLRARSNIIIVHSPTITMSAAAGRAATKVGQVAGRAASKANEVGNKKGPESALQKGAKRDPELYVSLNTGALIFGKIRADARSRSF